MSSITEAASPGWSVTSPITSNGLAKGDAIATPIDVEETDVLHASIKAGSVAQIVVAVVAVVGLIYVLKIVLVTTLTAMLLAFVLEPS